MSTTGGCSSHPFGSDHGATCILPDDHDGGHRYESTSAGDDRHADGGHG